MTSKIPATWTNNTFEDGNKSYYIDLSKTGTGSNYSLVGSDTLKDLKVNEKWITFDRRRGNKKQTYVEALTGNSICWGKNPTDSRGKPDKDLVYF